MTVKIDGTNTVANPAFTGADTDTGLQVGTDELKLVTGGTERATVDSSGRVLIGTSSSVTSETNRTLQVVRSDGAGIIALGRDDQSISSGNTLGKLEVYGNEGSTYHEIADITFAADDNHSSTSKPTGMRFSTTASSSTTSAERMRINSDGQMLLGATTASSTHSLIECHKASGQNYVRIISDALSDNEYAMFRARATAGGSTRSAWLGLFKHSNISKPCAFMLLEAEDGVNNYYWTDNSNNFRSSTSVTSVGTTSGTVVGTQTSDLRLKNVGADVSYGLAEVKQLQPKQYALKDDPDVNKLGFIAQEVESIIPEAVYDTLDELEGHQEGDRTKLGMEYVQLIPVLVNAIKELSAEVDTLKTQNACLEARLTALEGGS